ncbi:MAG: methylated-DNA--[protein]-cysteine S-methyltransferase [Planctomycetota bacterium]
MVRSEESVRDVRISRLDTPLGVLEIVTVGDDLVRLHIGRSPAGHLPDWLARHGLPSRPLRGGAAPAEVVAQLSEYFAGDRRLFELPIRPLGSAFQQRIWRCLERIPYGETRSYGEVAEAAGAPRAARAVGLACGANPLPIVIPCHRVLAAGGRPGGFGGGLELKRRLLELEGYHPGW